MMKNYMISILFAMCLLSISASAQENTVRTVADKGTSGMFFAKLCPQTNVAIDKNDADVFSVYTDGASARFAQGRIWKSKYVIPAGTCVIIKTAEEKDVQIESTTSTSSSFVWNDLISPATDKTLEEFKTENGVTEGQYIYMLTNLERNGGFGFTHFGGTTLRAGNFYLITTGEPSASGRLTTVWVDANGNEINGVTGIGAVNRTDESGEVYNLQGIKTTEPAVSGIYVSKGKKYVVK